MTIDVIAPTVRNPIAGIGPYALGWPYYADTVTAAVEIDGVVTELDPIYFSVTPTASTTSGNLYLTPDTAALHAGKMLVISRRTPPEQGWQATQGERETGLETQLDRIVMLQQEQAGQLAGTLRVSGAAVAPLIPEAGRSIFWDGAKFVPGPVADEIANAQSYAERAELAAGALTSLTDRIAYPFEITLLAGRGPYALPYDPGSATYLDIVINRLSYVAPDDFTVVAMPSAASGKGILFTADHYAGDAVMVKYGLPVGHDPALNTALTYATLADFAAAVTAGLVMPNGQTVTAGSVRLVAEVGAALTGLPLGWRTAEHVYTFAELELWPTDFRPGAQHILVNVDGYFVAYEHDPTGAATDLTTANGQAFIKRGISPADLTTLAADVANSIRQNATSGIGVYGGTANAITLDVGSGYAVFPTRYTIKFRATATNTGAATVAVDGLPAVALRTVTGVALPAGYIRTDVDTEITFDGTYWVVGAVAAETAMTRAQLVAYVTGRAVQINMVMFAGGVAYRYIGTGTAIADMPGWVPEGDVTPQHFGAAGDNVTDDLAAFNAAEAYGVSPIIVTKTHYLSADPSSRLVTYILLAGASVRLASGTWFPRLSRDETYTPFFRKYNPLELDDSPEIVGAEYPLSTTAPVTRSWVTNMWGKQHVDLNDTSKGRTGINMALQQFAHYGEGDMYGVYYGGTIYRHPRHASITHVRGQNNGGFGGGQMNAGTDQVTLYGWGDEVLKDRGFSNVALRGRVLMLYADGTDTYGYTVDRFGQFIMSRGANNIDGAYIASGKMRTGLDLSKVVTSDNSAINMASGQKIWFDTSGAAVTTGYVANALGSYSIGKNSTLNQIDILANSGALFVSGSAIQYTPSSDQVYAIKAYGVSVATNFASIGAAGNVGYVTAGSDAAANTTLAFRTAAAGVESDVVTIGTSGTVNIVKTNATLQIESTKVLGARIRGWSAWTGAASRGSYDTSTVTLAQLAQAFRALNDDLRTHGLIGD